MTQSIVMRLLMAASAAALVASLPAQSAPMSRSTARAATPAPSQDPVAAPAPKARAEAADKVQVRLAEVMAMLEEDDMSAEQQQKALAKLTEVMERLKKERATTPRPAGMGLGGAAVAPGGASGGVWSRVAPDGAPGGQVFGRVVPSVPGGKPEQLEALGVPMPPQPAIVPDAQAPSAPRATRAPRAPRAPKPPTALESVAAPEAAVEVAPGVLDAPRVFRRLPMGEDPSIAHDQLLLVEKAHAEAAKAHADAAKAQADLAKRHAETTRKRYVEGRAAAESELDTARSDEMKVLLQRIGKQKAEAAEVEEQVVKAKRQMVDRANTTRKTEGAAPGRVRSENASGDDAEIRATIEQMRAEMREIRALMQEIRARRQSEDHGEHEGQHEAATEVHTLAPLHAGTFTVRGREQNSAK